MEYRSVPEDFFEKNNGYLLRCPYYNDDVKRFLSKCVQSASECGFISEKQLDKPRADQTNACLNAIGQSSLSSEEDINRVFTAYMNMNGGMLQRITAAVYKVRRDQAQKGSNDIMLKNMIVKFMCWLRSSCYDSVKELSSGKNPKLVFQAQPSKHELLFLHVLASGGYDVVVIEKDGSEYYASADPDQAYSDVLSMGETGAYPNGFSVLTIKNEADREKTVMGRFSDPSLPKFCVNAWLSGELLDDVRVMPHARGDEPDTLYTCFARINGVENKANYMNSLYSLYAELKDSRRTVVIDKSPDMPSNEEIAAVKRGSYANISDLILGMSANISHSSVILQRLMQKAFAEVMMDFFTECNDLRKTLNNAVYTLCLLKKYQFSLFSGWNMNSLACVLILNCGNSSREISFIRMLSRLPADVLIFEPELRSDVFTDKLMYERNYTESLKVPSFPMSQSEISMGTVAYYAERDLDDIMHNEVGMYRDFQFPKANSVILSTMYEEVRLLWGQEMKFRPNFSACGDTVTLPVIAARISGVKGTPKEFWKDIRELITENTLVISNSTICPTAPDEAFAGRHMLGSKLKKDGIKQAREYKYGFLRNETQEHILDKIQLLIDKKIINDSDRHIAAVCLNMHSKLLRLIQSFDFTRSNPKLVYINTTENTISLDDSIMLAFLVNLGFDVLLVIPTGYLSAEKYYNTDFFITHQLGDFCYDLSVPKLYPQTKRQGLFKRIFS